MLIEMVMEDKPELREDVSIEFVVRDFLSYIELLTVRQYLLAMAVPTRSYSSFRRELW